MSLKTLGTFCDISGFNIWGPDGENGKKSNFVFSFRDGRPRVTVYTGVKGIEGMITWPTNMLFMAGMFTALEDVANGDNDRRIDVDALGAVYQNEQRTNEKKVNATMHVGKSKEGVVYISVTAENKPKLVFPIKSDEWHVFKEAGVDMDKGKVSRYLALGIAKLGISVLSQVMVSHTSQEYEAGVRKVAEIKPREGANNTKQIPSKMVQSLDELDI